MLTESATELQARFRRIDCNVGETTRELPRSLPPTWLMPEIAGHTARYVESGYREGASEAELANVFRFASQVTVTPMTLREIFLALARTYRLGKSS
jgi:ABC-2 type transport system ATP-binding protein